MIRAAVKRRLTVLLAEALAATDDYPGVHVTYTWDGQPITDSTLFLGLSTGRFDPESIGWVDPLTVDLWTIDAELWMFGFHSAEAAEAAIETAVQIIDTLLRSLRRLHLDGDGGDEPETFRGIRSVRLGQVEGPFHSFPQPNSGNLISGTVGLQLDCAADL